MGLDDMRHQRDGECIHNIPLWAPCVECKTTNTVYLPDPARPFEPLDHLRIRGAVKMIEDLSYGHANKAATQRLLAIADIVEKMEKPS